MHQESFPPKSASTTQPERILVVDDEPLIRDTLSLALADEGYEVITAPDGQAALDILHAPDHAVLAIDLAILDWMLPGVNGLDICRYMRHQHPTLPILILSARGSELDRVVGLEVGADDYLAKPFGIRELIARCRALLRRYRQQRRPAPPLVLSFKGIVLYSHELRVVLEGREINLSPKEFRILELLMQHPQRVWSREDLIERVWGVDFVGDRKTVDVHIRWLREKIEPDPSRPQYVTTLRGFGYRLG